MLSNIGANRSLCIKECAIESNPNYILFKASRNLRRIAANTTATVCTGTILTTNENAFTYIATVDHCQHPMFGQA